MFFLTALYLQQVHGDSALDAGAHFVPMGIAAIVSAIVGAQLVTRFGTRAAYIVGSAVGVVGLLLLSRAGAGSGYAPTSCPGLVVFGLGLPLVGVATRSPPSPRSRTRTPARPRASSPRRSRSAGRSGSRSSRPRRRRASPTCSPAARRSPTRWPRASSAGCSSPPASRSLNLLVGAVRAPRIKPDAALVAEAAAG